MVSCLERGADLHMAQLMPLPLTVSCFSKIQIGFSFLVPAHPGSLGQRAVKRVCVCVCVKRSLYKFHKMHSLVSEICKFKDYQFENQLASTGNQLPYLLAAFDRVINGTIA